MPTIKKYRHDPYCINAVRVCEGSEGRLTVVETTTSDAALLTTSTSFCSAAAQERSGTSTPPSPSPSSSSQPSNVENNNDETTYQIDAVPPPLTALDVAAYHTAVTADASGTLASLSRNDRRIPLIARAVLEFLLTEQQVNSCNDGVRGISRYSSENDTNCSQEKRGREAIVTTWHKDRHRSSSQNGNKHSRISCHGYKSQHSYNYNNNHHHQTQAPTPRPQHPLPPGTLHTDLWGILPFAPYPDTRFTPPEDTIYPGADGGDGNESDPTVRCFIGQLPYFLTESHLAWLLYTFGGRHGVTLPERIIKRSPKIGGRRQATGCIHAFSSRAGLKVMIKLMHKRLLVDATGVWYCQDEAQTQKLKAYIQWMDEHKSKRPHGTPYQSLIVQEAKSHFSPEKPSYLSQPMEVSGAKEDEPSKSTGTTTTGIYNPYRDNNKSKKAKSIYKIRANILA